MKMNSLEEVGVKIIFDLQSVEQENYTPVVLGIEGETLVLASSVDQKIQGALKKVVLLFDRSAVTRCYECEDFVWNTTELGVTLLNLNFDSETKKTFKKDILLSKSYVRGSHSEMV